MGLASAVAAEAERINHSLNTDIGDGGQNEKLQPLAAAARKTPQVETTFAAILGPFSAFSQRNVTSCSLSLEKAQGYLVWHVENRKYCRLGASQQPSLGELVELIHLEAHWKLP